MSWVPIALIVVSVLAAPFFVWSIRGMYRESKELEAATDAIRARTEEIREQIAALESNLAGGQTDD